MLKIYTQSRYIVFLLGSVLLWQGCNVINPTEQTPTYVHIDSFNFVSDPTAATAKLTLSHQITCIWVYYNNSAVGVFDLPATFPVMATGTGQLEVYPGVAVNGQNGNNGIYPFYQPDTFSFAAQPGKTFTRLPVTKYYPNIKVTKIADFENHLTNFGLDGGNIPMTVVSKFDTALASFVFEGNYSGRILLSNPGVDSSIDSSTISAFKIASGNAYIEFNYKNDIPFYVGLQANLVGVISTTPYYLDGIFPSDHWQKFYMNVADFAGNYPADNYNFYIKASLLSGTSGTVLLDNIQLITY